MKLAFRRRASSSWRKEVHSLDPPQGADARFCTPEWQAWEVMQAWEDLAATNPDAVSSRIAQLTDEEAANLHAALGLGGSELGDAEYPWHVLRQ